MFAGGLSLGAVLSIACLLMHASATPIPAPNPAAALSPDPAPWVEDRICRFGCE
ncbi:hypothetical protein PLICRDRAFT_170292 [Plicaturopsis crispa FD-325 SS-3]|nr:hypothetical protein PLICRDRAFT_170292 [Plicaturopsis crispa FD-325 SS-3]